WRKCSTCSAPESSSRSAAEELPSADEPDDEPAVPADESAGPAQEPLEPDPLAAARLVAGPPAAPGAGVFSAQSRSSGSAAVASTLREGPRSWAQRRGGEPAWRTALTCASVGWAESVGWAGSAGARAQGGAGARRARGARGRPQRSPRPPQPPGREASAQASPRRGRAHSWASVASSPSSPRRLAVKKVVPSSAAATAPTEAAPRVSGTFLSPSISTSAVR